MHGELDLETLERLLARLREAVERYAREPDNDAYLDSLIKRFELSFELTRNALIRYIETYGSRMNADDLRTLPGYIRTANQEGLLRGDWHTWFEYRKTRNEAVHSYNEDVARSIAERVPAFLEEAEYACAQMKLKIASSSQPDSA